MPEFSEYIIFVDESGDHGLENIDPAFPLFALSFCIISKEEYITQVVPEIQKLKFEFWGHDGIILHEHELRKSTGDFAFLRASSEIREQFMSRLSDLMQNAPIEIVAAVIDKANLRQRYVNPWNPYELALTFCMERALGCLLKNGQAKKLTHVIFESRGKKEDNELELEFRRICDNDQKLRNWRTLVSRPQQAPPTFSDLSFEPRFLPKSVNSSGLQLADLTARPIAINTLRPEQPNRAYEIIEKKLFAKKRFP